MVRLGAQPTLALTTIKVTPRGWLCVCVCTCLYVCEEGKGCVGARTDPFVKLGEWIEALLIRALVARYDFPGLGRRRRHLPQPIVTGTQARAHR
jgi:hypothetical protein